MCFFAKYSTLWRVVTLTYFLHFKIGYFHQLYFTINFIYENTRNFCVWLKTVLSYKHTCSEILCCSLLEIELMVCHLLVLLLKSTIFVPHQYIKHHTPLLSQLLFSLTSELCVKFKLFLNKLAGREKLSCVYFYSGCRHSLSFIFCKQSPSFHVQAINGYA